MIFPSANKTTALAGIVIGLWICQWAFAQNAPLAPAGQLERGTKKILQVTGDLAKIRSMQTSVGYRALYTNKPPWPQGNCLTMASMTNESSGLPPGEWRLANMHAENFWEFTQSQKITRLDFGLLANHVCVVVDARVPAAWLRDRPCSGCYSLPKRIALKNRYPQLFKRHPLEDALIQSTWVLASRQDPDGLITQVLPGDKIQFASSEITCATAAGGKCGVRLWEPYGIAKPYHLSIYDVQFTNTYTGASFSVISEPGMLQLTFVEKLHSDSHSVGGEVYQGIAEARYRRE